MIGHQAEGQDAHRESLDRQREQVEEGCIIVGLVKHFRASIATIQHVVAHPTNSGSSGTRHRSSLTVWPLSVQKSRMSPFSPNPGSIGTSDSTSTFPSGDGHAGGTFNFLVTLLAGDADLDNYVSYEDYETLIANYVTLTGMSFTDADCNGDGAVNFADYSLLVGTYGLNLQGGVGMPGDIANHNGPGDFDWCIDDADMDVVISHYGLSNVGYENGDINCDGHVDMADVNFMMAHYGLELSVSI
jgi:hypothetical protein